MQEGAIEPGTEVFVITDNAVAESTFFKGSSKSSLLHDMIVNLRRLEMEGQLIVHFNWVSGVRMQAQGTDGLSRGELGTGVMQGIPFCSFLPFNETALQRHRDLQHRLAR